jgi:hypothetical protein
LDTLDAVFCRSFTHLMSLLIRRTGAAAKCTTIDLHYKMGDDPTIIQDMVLLLHVLPRLPLPNHYMSRDIHKVTLGH